MNAFSNIRTRGPCINWTRVVIERTDIENEPSLWTPAAHLVPSSRRTRAWPRDKTSMMQGHTRPLLLNSRELTWTKIVPLDFATDRKSRRTSHQEAVSEYCRTLLYFTVSDGDTSLLRAETVTFVLVVTRRTGVVSRD